MKSKKTQTPDVEQNSFGLVASGIAGAWEVALDETVEGTQRWFAQIEGPTCYIYFQVRHPRVIEEMAKFLRRHLCQDKCLQGSTPSPDHSEEIELSHLGGSIVSLI